jgi:hypothetical protein
MMVGFGKIIEISAIMDPRRGLISPLSTEIKTAEGSQRFRWYLDRGLPRAKKRRMLFHYTARIVK